MGDDLYKIEVRDVVGPLPDGQGMIIVRAGGKSFPIACPLPDAAACFCHIHGSPFDSPYVFLSSSLKDLGGVSLLRAELLEVERALYAKMYFMSPEWETPIRRSSYNPAEAVNLSLISDPKEFGICKSSLRRIVDSSDAFAYLRKSIGSLWPMAPLTNTSELQALHEYLEEAMPGGSIFGRPKGQAPGV